MKECQHKFYIQVKKGREMMIELSCLKCNYYFVMTKDNFNRVLELKEEIQKLLILENLE